MSLGFDALSQRYQVALYGGLVALAAYFQAAGIGQLVAGHLTPSSPPKVTAAPLKESSAANTKSGAAILSRNPFDSVTGPLDGSVVDPSDTAKPVVRTPGGDPYQDQACNGVRSSLVTATEDHAWSFASLSSNEGEKLRRIGDKVGTFTVNHIGYYESPDGDVMPRVWLSEGGSRCIVEMGAPQPGVPKPSVNAPPKAPVSSRRAKLEAEVKSKITKVGENSYEVDKSGVELIIQNYAKLGGAVRGKASKEGMVIKGIREGSILGELGMKNGDMLQSINNYDMSDPDKALDAYAKLRRAGTLDMTVMRDGAPFTVKVQIKK